MKAKIKKISKQQATKYFSQDEDLIDSPIRFYTLTEDEDGWDKITYIPPDVKIHTLTAVKLINGFIYYLILLYPTCSK